MDKQVFSLTQISELLENAFAPWVLRLNIKPIEVNEDGAMFTIPENPELSRDNGFVCGQALSALADTVGVLTLCAHNNEYKPMTTVDMTNHFMRPLSGDVEVRVTILSNGKRMATIRADASQIGSPKIAATATCAYAYL